VSDTFKTGDRVQVTLTGTVTAPLDGDNEIRLNVEGNISSLFIAPNAEAVEVTKIQPEFFGVGDIVRTKVGNRYTYTIGEDGYFCHTTSTWNRCGEGYTPTLFPSAQYELVAQVGGSK
jgi:hypothetical protein